MSIGRFALHAFAALGAVTALAGEAEWKARYDTANAALMQTDRETSKALFASLATDLEAALRQELAKGKDRGETATAGVWLASVYLHQDKYGEAARLLQAAYDIRVK